MLITKLWLTDAGLVDFKGCTTARVGFGGSSIIKRSIIMTGVGDVGLSIRHVSIGHCGRWGRTGHWWICVRIIRYNNLEIASIMWSALYVYHKRILVSLSLSKYNSKILKRWFKIACLDWRLIFTPLGILILVKGLPSKKHCSHVLGKLYVCLQRFSYEPFTNIWKCLEKLF